MPILLVIAGGGVGSGLRYLVGLAGLRLLGPALPYGTFAVNLTGGFFMGLLVATLARHGAGGNEAVRLLVGVGVLGGYTTFSSFSLEAAAMIERGALGVALAYVLASAAGAILCLFAGLAVGRAIA